MLKIAFDKRYILPLPEGHRFPMMKYELIPSQLLYEGIVSKENFFSPKKSKTIGLKRHMILNTYKS